MYTDLKIIGECNYIKLPSQYLWDNTSLQKNFLLLLFLALQFLVDRKPLPQFPSAVLSPATYVSNALYLQIILHAGLSLLFPSGFQLQKVLKTYFVWGEVVSLMPNPQPVGPGYPI